MSRLKLVSAMLVMTAVTAIAAVAGPAQKTLAVLQLRSSLAANDRSRVDAMALEDEIRDAAEKGSSGLHVLERGQPAIASDCTGDCEIALVRKAGADLIVGGDLLRVDEGFLVSLELRDARSGRLLGMQTALASAPAELTEAVAGAAGDLLKSQRPQLMVNADDLPELPAPPGPLQEGGALKLAVDASVLVAYDAARKADAHGSENPEEAAIAWEAVAELQGKNPYAAQAAERAAQWHAYAGTESAFAQQLASDTAQLRKVLPLESVKPSARLELLGRYARAYGAEKANPLVALLPELLRPRAGLTIRCERGEPAACLNLAKMSDEAGDASAAAGFFERACEAGAAKACAEAGDRLLQPALRDPTRALAALQIGCNANDPRSCARLARTYEEGDGTDANLEVAGRLREKACTAGDGRSCRKLACFVEGDTPQADTARALELSLRGCKEGDQVSCAIAKALSPKKRKVIAPGGKAVASQGDSAAAPKTPAPLQFMPPPPHDRSSGPRVVAGVVLIGLAMGLTTAALSEHDGLHGAVSSHIPGHEHDAAHHTMWSRITPTQFGLGAGALLSAGFGLTLLLTHPAPATPAVALTAGPGGLMFSGTMP